VDDRIRHRSAPERTSPMATKRRPKSGGVDVAADDRVRRRGVVTDALTERALATFAGLAAGCHCGHGSLVVEGLTR
jgi:hypothetical protein